MSALQDSGTRPIDPLYRIPLETIDGWMTTLEPYAGNVLLIVNTASRCGFTSQYAGLEALFQKLKSRGLVVLGFPCNQFARQERGHETAIKNFCQLTYGVTFPLFAKIEVNGPGTHPLYSELKRRAPGLFGTESIKWNFTKFLVAPGATRIARYAPTTSPEGIEPDILALLDPSN